MNKVALSDRWRLPLAGLSGGGVTARGWPAWMAGLLWLLVGLSAGYWVLLAWGRGPMVPVSASAASLPQTDVALVARALGSFPQVATETAAPAPPATRYRLVGVVSRRNQSGAALIAVNDQPPRPYTVGAVLEGELVLQSVERRVARLGPALNGPSTVELELAPVAD